MTKPQVGRPSNHGSISGKGKFRPMIYHSDRP